jgi:hypothetical protein
MSFAAEIGGLRDTTATDSKSGQPTHKATNFDPSNIAVELEQSPCRASDFSNLKTA